MTMSPEMLAYVSHEREQLDLIEKLDAEKAALLEACKGMLAILDGTMGRRWEGAFADAVRAAIAKAEGRK